MWQEGSLQFRRARKSREVMSLWGHGYGCLCLKRNGEKPGIIPRRDTKWLGIAIPELPDVRLKEIGLFVQLGRWLGRDDLTFMSHGRKLWSAVCDAEGALGSFTPFQILEELFLWIFRVICVFLGSSVSISALVLIVGLLCRGVGWRGVTCGILKAGWIIWVILPLHSEPWLCPAPSCIQPRGREVLQQY